MNHERPDLPVTIARLVRSAGPVTPLAAPPVRLARWVAASTGLGLLSVAVLGVRADAAARMTDAWFVARAGVTLAIACAAALVAFRLAVPGDAPARRVLALPLAACLLWAAMLAGAVVAAPSPVALLRLVTPHPSCILFIAATALLPAVAMVRMLRRAAPLEGPWTGGFAALASVAAGALGAQFVCANDAAAHHLLWHFAPVILFALAGLAAGPLLFGSPVGGAARLPE